MSWENFTEKLIALGGAGFVLKLIGAIVYFGVETTTFAALIAGAGLAIGAAWGGLLSNFAAGVFLVVLRPQQRMRLVQAGS